MSSIMKLGLPHPWLSSATSIAQKLLSCDFEKCLEQVYPSYQVENQRINHPNKIKNNSYCLRLSDR